MLLFVFNICVWGEETERRTYDSGYYMYVLQEDGTAEIVNVYLDLLSEINELEIPVELDGHSVTSIGDWAFAGCTGLTSIEIPDSVTSIGDWAFAGCTGLTNIEIPDSVTSIGDGAFWGCGSLTSIEIPDSVTSIGNAAFRYCTGLTSIEIPDSVTSIGEVAFSGCDSLIITVVRGSYAEQYCRENDLEFKYTDMDEAEAYYLKPEYTPYIGYIYDTGYGLEFLIPDDVTSGWQEIPSDDVTGTVMGIYSPLNGLSIVVYAGIPSYEATLEGIWQYVSANGYMDVKYVSCNGKTAVQFDTPWSSERNIAFPGEYGEVVQLTIRCADTEELEKWADMIFQTVNITAQYGQ